MRISYAINYRCFQIMDVSSGSYYYYIFLILESHRIAQYSIFFTSKSLKIIHCLSKLNNFSADNKCTEECTPHLILVLIAETKHTLPDLFIPVTSIVKNLNNLNIILHNIPLCILATPITTLLINEIRLPLATLLKFICIKVRLEVV